MQRSRRCCQTALELRTVLDAFGVRVPGEVAVALPNWPDHSTLWQFGLQTISVRPKTRLGLSEEL